MLRFEEITTPTNHAPTPNLTTAIPEDGAVAIVAHATAGWVWERGWSGYLFESEHQPCCVNTVEPFRTLLCSCALSHIIFSFVLVRSTPFHDAVPGNSLSGAGRGSSGRRRH